MLGIAAADPISWLESTRAHEHKNAAFAPSEDLPAERLEGGFECEVEENETIGLAAGLMECSGIDLLSYVPTEEFSGDTTLADANPLDTQEASDMWGWVDPTNDREYVIIGKTNGVAFYDITDPEYPVHVASMDNTSPVQLLWHDIKVFDDHAFIVSESNGHGMQVVDLTRLRGLDGTEGPEQLLPDTVYPLANAAHNLALNEDSGMAYIVGANTGLVATDQCRSGLHIVDVNIPIAPVFAGCYALDGGPGTAANAVGLNTPTVAGVRSSAAYVHDAQCVTYAGPDTDYTGSEICVLYAEDRVVIVDATIPAVPLTVASFTYPDATYTHQGWFTEDHAYILFNDELDEEAFDEAGNVDPRTRTMITDLTDLDNPGEPMIHRHDNTNIDHNLYTHDGAVYQSHYSEGLRVSDLDRIAEGVLEEVAFFDVHPDDDDQQYPAPTFHGTWSNYPYFPSGTVAISGYEGLWLVELHDDTLAAIAD